MRTITILSIASIFFINLFFISPTTTYASWWKPTTWKIFTKQNKPQTQNLETSVPVTNGTSSVTQSNLLDCNGSKYKRCPTDQTFVCPTDGQDGYCEKSKVNEVKTPKLKEVTTQSSAVKTAKVVAPTVTKTSKVESENFNFLIVGLLDRIIPMYQEYDSYLKNVEDVFLTRIERDRDFSIAIKSNIVDSVPKGVNIPNDMYRAMAVVVDQEIEALNGGAGYGYIHKTRGTLSETLQKIRNIREEENSKFYTREQAVAQMKEAMKLYDLLDSFSNAGKKGLDFYTTYTSKNDTTISGAIEALRKNNEDYQTSARIKQIYQQNQPAPQIVIPKIELPKTTYCQMSYTGIHGNYDISCTER